MANYQNKNGEKVCIKNSTCYFFDVLIKVEDFDFDNILLDEKSYENIMIGTIPLVLGSIK